MSWNQDEEIYLHSIQKSCESLSNQYLEKHRKWRMLQAKIKIPVIVIGSFTGITSFGTETFPLESQKWISVGVGIITVGIAILNTIESYFKIGESANAALNASNALQQLREDINKELSVPEEDRQAPGITFLRDCFTRYQQILNQAPTLDHGSVNYIDALISNKINVMIKRNNKRYKREEEELERSSVAYGGRNSATGEGKSGTPKSIMDRFRGIMGARPSKTPSPPALSPLPMVALETVKEGIVMDNGFLNADLMKAKLSGAVGGAISGGIPSPKDLEAALPRTPQSFKSYVDINNVVAPSIPAPASVAGSIAVAAPADAPVAAPSEEPVAAAEEPVREPAAIDAEPAEAVEEPKTQP